ncbi:hypothetical protein MMC25_003318 [Agyrium rufum]|nr:hypothetical protein [Agyrium rufum]
MASPAPVVLTETTFQILIGVFFGLAILFSICRFVIRWRLNRRFFVDDAFFLFALICSIASTATLYLALDHYYNIKQYSKVTLSYASDTLAFATIYAVKFTFIFFFRPLTERLPRLQTVWWITLLATCAGLVTVFQQFILCPYPGDRIKFAQCFEGNFLFKEVTNAAVFSGWDILTDCMILIIPSTLIIQASLKMSQKLGLAAALWLSILVICVSVLRAVYTPTSSNTTDIAFPAFLNALEGYVGIIIAAFASFRALFISSRKAKMSPPKQGFHYSQHTLSASFQNQSWVQSSKPPSRSQARLPEIERPSTLYVEPTGLSSNPVSPTTTRFARSLVFNPADLRFSRHFDGHDSHSLKGSGENLV